MNKQFKRHLKQLILSGSVCFLTAIAFAEVHTVTMKSISYDPKVLNIKVGDSVEWANKAYTEHSATSYEDEKPSSKFDTGMVKPQEISKKIDFKVAGSFSYHCLVHGKTMTGKINVTK